MDAPLIFPGLGEQLSNVIRSMRLNDHPTFSLKCKSGKVHLDIVWTTTQQVTSEPKPVMQDLDNTSLSDCVAVNKSPVELVWTKKWISHSTVKRDRRRFAIWLARKSGTTTEGMDTVHLEAIEPEVAKEPVNDSNNDDGNGTTMDFDDGNLDYNMILENLDTYEFDSVSSFESGHDDSESDTDLFLDFLNPRPKACCCNSSTEQLRICTKCFSAALCNRLQCKREHAKCCNPSKLTK